MAKAGSRHEDPLAPQERGSCDSGPILRAVSLGPDVAASPRWNWKVPGARGKGGAGRRGGEGREIERQDLAERCRDSDLWKMGLEVGCPHEALDTHSLTN